MTEKIVQTNPETPEPDTIRQAVSSIRKGGVIIFPTWCLYGLGADAFNEKAVETVFSIKKRRPDNPLLILIKERAVLKDLVTEIPDVAKRIMDRFWPGRVTIVFHAKSHIPSALTSGTGKIGIRIPEHPVARAIVRELDHPITGTSANLSGDPGCFNIAEMNPSLVERTDMTIDAGRLKGGKGSTIVDVTVEPIQILREGEVRAEEIENLIK